MNQPFDPIPDAYGFRLSNPPVLMVASLLASLEIFDRVTMPVLRAKSELLTGYLEFLLSTSFDRSDFQIITPKEPSERGCQLSLFWHWDISTVAELLEKRGVIVDVRKPNVIRVAPAPLYNSFEDVFSLVVQLKETIEELRTRGAKK